MDTTKRTPAAAGSAAHLHYELLAERQRFMALGQLLELEKDPGERMVLSKAWWACKRRCDDLETAYHEQRAIERAWAVRSGVANG